MSARATAPQPILQPAHLTRSAKLAYGAGDMAGSVVVTLTGFFLQAFLLDVAGLRPAAIGVIFLVSNVWDAVTDPVVGVLSDRTRTRWARSALGCSSGRFLSASLTFYTGWFPTLARRGCSVTTSPWRSCSRPLLQSSACLTPRSRPR